MLKNLKMLKLKNLIIVDTFVYVCKLYKFLIFQFKKIFLYFSLYFIFMAIDWKN